MWVILAGLIALVIGIIICLQKIDYHSLAFLTWLIFCGWIIFSGFKVMSGNEKAIYYRIGFSWSACLIAVLTYLAILNAGQFYSNAATIWISHDTINNMLLVMPIIVMFHLYCLGLVVAEQTEYCKKSLVKFFNNQFERNPETLTIYYVFGTYKLQLLIIVSILILFTY